MTARVTATAGVDFAALLRKVLDHLGNIESPRGGWYKVRCPFHDDAHPSLRLNEHGFRCMAASCDRRGSLVNLARHVGVMAEPRARQDRIERTYDYVDELGVLLYQAVRLHSPKDFFQRQPDGRGDWVNNLKGVRLVPYRLPELLAAPKDQVLFLVEGEKDVDRLRAEGLPATTNPMGAGTWRSNFNEFFHGRTVVIAADNDDSGRKHAAEVAHSLTGFAREVRVLELEGLPEKGDVSDWLNAGGTVDELRALALRAPVFAPDSDSDSTPEFNRTDAGNGELFARLYGDRLRYDHRRKQWLTWSGHRWSDDSDGEVRRLAKAAARHRYLGAPLIDDLQTRTAVAKFAIQSENRQRLEAMIVQAQSEPPIADAGGAWNADPCLLGVANGVVDLRSGDLRVGSPADSITMFVPVAYEKSAECPRWLQFLREVFLGDDELITFVRRAVGYSLTGLTTEQCLFLCHGKGSNGKSVLLAVLRAVAGSYAYNAPFSLFEKQNRSTIPNDVAALAGRRLVSSSETSEGTWLNEARVKALTGCDTVSARFLHGEFFEFEPVAKYWLAFNHKPRVGDDSHGFWRRVRLIPFNRQFDRGRDADDGLVAELLRELPGILAWAVRGAREWQAHGLAAPVSVAVATDDYRKESDPLAEFMDECCVVREGFTAAATPMFLAYKAWAGARGMGDREMLSATRFGTKMSAKFDKRHAKNGNVYDGIGLLSDLGDHEEVKGWVKGYESDSSENDVFAVEKRLTRENQEKPFTTLHPSPDERADPRCDGCGCSMSTARVGTLCGYCKRGSDGTR